MRIKWLFFHHKLKEGRKGNNITVQNMTHPVLQIFLKKNKPVTNHTHNESKAKAMECYNGSLVDWKKEKIIKLIQWKNGVVWRVFIITFFVSNAAFILISFDSYSTTTTKKLRDSKIFLHLHCSSFFQQCLKSNCHEDEAVWSFKA